MPGFWLLNQIGDRLVDGFPNPTLFTATAMIGMIALAGIVVRNSLILVEFVHLAGFFEEKIPIDFRKVVPPAETGETYTIAVVTEPLIERAAGTLRAKVETVISPLITATISSIAVWSGDEVQPGEELVSLDARELKARVDQAHQSVVTARAVLTQTEKAAKRVQRIFKADPGAISKAERDRVEAALSTARARLVSSKRHEDEARTALSYSKLTSPIAGRIVERYADPAIRLVRVFRCCGSITRQPFDWKPVCGNRWLPN
jgi:multidrug efflux pump subunit AcrA (membrane-fusion protein)